MALSSEGWIGLVTETAVVGDKVVVLMGAPLLHIVRNFCQQEGDRSDNNDVCSLVGEAYFHGFVDGRALEGRQLGTIVLG